MIFYIMGKSAVGKDHIYEALLRDETLHLQPVVLYTTRPPRAGETDGVEYHFTDEQHLEELLREDKVIEYRVYNTVYGPWYYFTADEGQLHPAEQDYLGIGTPESCVKLREHFGEACVCPVYIESDDGLRLERSLKRERKQKEPKYEEMCRRFLADQVDFSDERLRKAGIVRRFLNNGTLEDCIAEAAAYIRETRREEDR